MHVIEDLKLWQQMCFIPPIYCQRSSITNLGCFFFGAHICRLKLRDFLYKHTSTAYNLEKKLSRHTSMASKWGGKFRWQRRAKVSAWTISSPCEELVLRYFGGWIWRVVDGELQPYVAQEIFDMIKAHLMFLAMFLVLWNDYFDFYLRKNLIKEKNLIIFFC